VPRFRIRFHEEVYVDLCVEAPSREAVSKWAEDNDRCADAVSEHITQQAVTDRYVSDLALWRKDDGKPGTVHVIDEHGDQVRKETAVEHGIPTRSS